MGVFETLPYTNFQNTNLDFILKKLKKLENEVAEVVELSETWSDQVEALNARMLAIEEENAELRVLYDSFVIEITNQFNELKQEQIEAFNLLTESIDNRFNTLENRVNAMLFAFDLKLNALDNKVDEALANLPNYIIMTNPFTGEPDNLTNIIDQLASASRVDALTAGEYDALDLTALAYDNYEITAYDYDWSGKTILGS